MPFKVVTVRRWEVVGAFVLLVVVAVAVAAWNDHRINQAEKRIEAGNVADHRQNVTRAELVERFRRVNRVACLRIELLKAQNRQEARRNYRQLDRNLRLLNIRKTPQLARVARAELARDLRLNRPSNCSRR